MSVRLYLVVMVILFGVLAQPTFAQTTILTDEVDTYVMEHMAALNIPGMAVAIVQGDEIIYMQGYGIADPDGRAITPQTPFWLASLSKSITATAIMQLVEGGEIDLSAPVADYIPWFREGMNDPTPITVRHLLNQTSGFSRYSGHELLDNGDLSDDALERNARRLSSLPLLFAPGDDWEYSNSNYDVLGYLIQVVSGQPYERYIEEHIFAPLEMQHSYTRIDQAADVTSGYYPLWGNNRPVPTQFSRAITPSAGLIASAEDLAHYVIAHLNGGRYGDTSLLSAQGIAETHRASYALDLAESYAFGWFVQPLWEANVQDGQEYTIPVLITHDGAWQNFRAVIALIPEHTLGVVALMNANDFQRESMYQQIGEQLATLVIGAEPLPLFAYEDAFTQNARLLTLALIAAQLLLLAWSVINLIRWRQSPRRWTSGQIVRVILPPLVIDALIAVYILLGLPSQYESPLPVIIRSTPDTGAVLVVSLVISIGWGILRTLLYLLTMRTNREMALT